MANSRHSNHPQTIDRRNLLRFATAFSACARVPRVQAPADPQRNTKIDARNLGLITAHRPELSPEENETRNGELWCDLALCGRLLVRGRYVPPHGTAIEAQAFLVFGNPDDSGNLKGLLRKLGRKYGQNAVLHKPYYRDARLYALKNVPGMRSRKSEEKILGGFRPELIGGYLTLMTNGSANSLLDGDLRFEKWNRLSSCWKDITLWAHRGGLYPKQSPYWVPFDIAVSIANGTSDYRPWLKCV